jgi:hypothetical protein
MRSSAALLMPIAKISSIMQPEDRHSGTKKATGTCSPFEVCPAATIS